MIRRNLSTNVSRYKHAFACATNSLKHSTMNVVCVLMITAGNKNISMSERALG